MITSVTAAVPETGQLVEVRRRQWVVTEIHKSAFAPKAGRDPQHLVSLVSLGEDAVAEEQSVLWELEPGARIIETAGLPALDGWDKSEELEAFLDAVRWGASVNADRGFLQSPFRSGVEIQDFQLEPVARAIDMARANLLIADDVGLGKTIEAGLVIQELLIRHRARTAFIVCPASLQIKWETEMREKFGLEFRIVDTDYIRRLRRERGLHANPWTSFPRLIASMDWMKSGEGLRLLKDVLPSQSTFPRKFDILVVDEAHNVAPASASRWAMPSQRTRLIRTLSPHFENRLFLTATPHNGNTQSFTSLLEMLDDQRFARGVMPNEAQKERVMIRRLKSDLVDENGNRIYPVRELLPLEIEYSSDELAAYEVWDRYKASREGSSGDSTGGAKVDFIHSLLKKRLFSSPRAFYNTLSKHRETLLKPKKKKQKKDLNERILKKAIMKMEEDYANDFSIEDAADEAMEVATEMSRALTDDQKSMLNQLLDWSNTAKNRPDTKAKAVLEWLEDHLKTDGEVNDKRVILFTEWKATHSWMMEVLASHGWGGDLLMVMDGGTDHDEREEIKAAFQSHPGLSPVRILLATDSASEGIDLQLHCNYMIHLEIPWNPNVLEQRNGRIDRHGQKQSKVQIWYPVGSGIAQSEDFVNKPGDLKGDQEYLYRIALKSEKQREDLGSVGPVLARQTHEAMLGRRSNIDTREAEANAAKAKAATPATKKIQEMVARLHKRLLETQDEYKLTPDRVAAAVKVALKLAGKPPIKPKRDSKTEGLVYELPPMAGSWGSAARGLQHPHTGMIRPITFDHAVSKGRDDVVLAHLQHRLVQMSLRLLREEIWQHSDAATLNRVTVREITDDLSEVPVVLLWSRIIISGASYHRLHEELTFSGGELKSAGFARIRTLSKLMGLRDASQPVEPDAAAFKELRRRFQACEEGILRAMEARSRERLQSLMNTLDLRMEAEREDLGKVLDDLAAMINKELERTNQVVQQTFNEFKDEEKEQLRRDESALQARLERIPEEKQAEQAAIARRYSEPTDRTFPVAVELLVPESFGKEGF